MRHLPKKKISFRKRGRNLQIRSHTWDWNRYRLHTFITRFTMLEKYLDLCIAELHPWGLILDVCKHTLEAGIGNSSDCRSVFLF